MRSLRLMTGILLSALLPLGVVSLPVPALADTLENQIRQESLLRRYSSSEAQSRYENYRRDNDAANKALGAGLTNLTGRLFQRSQEAMKEAERNRDLWEDMWFKVDIGKPVVVRNAKEGKIMAEMLQTNHLHSWRAAKLLAEHALWLHADSPLVFAQPQEAEVAAMLRRKAYGLETRQFWAANMLGKMYLAGVGVPRDEEEALRLFTQCASIDMGPQFGQASQSNSAEKIGTVHAQCLLNAASIYENGWGVLPDAKKAAELRDKAASAYNKANGTGWNGTELTARLQP